MSGDNHDEELFQSARSSMSEYHTAESDETFVKRWEYSILSIRDRECEVCEIEDVKNVKVLKLPPNELGDSILEAFENCSGTVLIRYLECGTYKGVVDFRLESHTWKQPNNVHLNKLFQSSKNQADYNNPEIKILLQQAISKINGESDCDIQTTLEALDVAITEEMNSKKLPNKKRIESFQTLPGKSIVTPIPGPRKLADYDEMGEASRSSNAPSAANKMEPLLAMKNDLLKQKADLLEKLTVVEKKIKEVECQIEKCVGEQFF